MTDLRKAAEQALKALEEIGDEWGFTSERTVPNRTKAIQALRQALAQPVDAVNMNQERVDETAKGEHEPVAWMGVDSYGNVTKFRTNEFGGGIPLYTAPPSIEAAVLAEREACAKVCDEREKPNLYGVRECAAAIRARGEK